MSHGTTRRPLDEAPATAGRRAWLLLGLAVMALMAARVPAVSSMIREQVDAAISSGELANTEQRSLAVTIGVTVALALSIGVTLVVIALAHRFEARLRLPAARALGRSVSGLLVIVAAGLVSKQVASIALAPQGRSFTPALWAVVATSVVAAVVVVAASTDRGGPRARAVSVGLAVGLATAAI